MLAMAGWAAAWRLVGDRWGWLALLNLHAFWLLVVGIPLGAARLWPRRKPLAAGWGLAGLALLAGRYQWTWRWALPKLEGPVDGETVDGRRLRIMSTNMLMDNEHLGQLIDAIQQAKPDILMIQEFEAGTASRFEEALHGFPHRSLQKNPADGANFGFFSGVPFELTGSWDSPGTRAFCARITLALPGGPADLYSLHLQDAAPHTLRKTGIAHNFRLRERQIRMLVEDIERRGNPAVGAGDCNMSEGNDAYLLFSSRLTDAWLVAGRGPGWSWPRALGPFLPFRFRTQPLLRLDYCFANRRVEPRRMHVVSGYVGSDHCPLIVDVSVGL